MCDWAGSVCGASNSPATRQGEMIDLPTNMFNSQSLPGEKEDHAAIAGCRVKQAHAD